MPGKDLYQDLCKSYEFMLGPLPQEEEFKQALQETVTEEELRIYFLLPFAGTATLDKLQKKAGMPIAQLKTILDRLASEGMIMSYTAKGQTVYERGNPIFMTEQQVRKAEDTPRRAFYARFFNSILNGEITIAAPTKTPYYRVLPVDPPPDPRGRGDPRSPGRAAHRRGLRDGPPRRPLYRRRRLLLPPHQAPVGSGL
jgi:DNA-binding MarR family transcriptional regulator